jgi:hypothetical protein
MTKTALGLELSVAEQERLFNRLARLRNPSVIEVLALERLNNILLNRERYYAWRDGNPEAHAAIVSKYEESRRKVKSKKRHFIYDDEQGLCGFWYPENPTDDIKNVTCHSCRRRYNSGTMPSR